MPDDAYDLPSLEWIKKRAEEERSRREAMESIPKSVRYYVSEIEIIEARAKQVDISFSKYCRLMTLGYRPDIEAAVAALLRLMEEAETLADQASAKGVEVTRPRKLIEELSIAFGETSPH